MSEDKDYGFGLTAETFMKVNLLLAWQEINSKLRNSHLRCSVKKSFLKISQNSQENICVGVPF